MPGPLLAFCHFAVTHYAIACSNSITSKRQQHFRPCWFIVLYQSLVGANFEGTKNLFLGTRLSMSWSYALYRYVLIFFYCLAIMHGYRSKDLLKPTMLHWMYLKIWVWTPSCCVYSDHVIVATIPVMHSECYIMTRLSNVCTCMCVPETIVIP